MEYPTLPENVAIFCTAATTHKIINNISDAFVRNGLQGVETSQLYEMVYSGLDKLIERIKLCTGNFAEE